MYQRIALVQYQTVTNDPYQLQVVYINLRFYQQSGLISLKVKMYDNLLYGYMNGKNTSFIIFSFLYKFYINHVD